MKRRLALITEIIAPYRIPVFNALAARDDVNLSVIFLAETDSSLRQWRVYKEDIRFSYRVLPSWRWRIGGCNVLLNRGMSEALNQSGPETVVCGGYNYLASWEALWWAREHRIPFLLWSESNARDERSYRAIVEFFKRRFLAYCDGFVVPGKSSKEYLRQLRVQRQLIFTAPNAIDVAFFSEAAMRARQTPAEIREARNLPRRYFLYVGRLVAEKGIFDLLKAYAKLKDDTRQAVGLVFVGDGEQRMQLETRAREIVGGCVRFTGFAHREELAELYGLAEVFALPTHTDPWGLVVNEALACGLPVIVSSAAGCVDDLVDDRVNGFVVPPGDIARLAEAMETLAGNGELRVRMASQSIERTRQHSPEAWAKGIAEAATALSSEKR
jgi:glycosyltransferase involved in cell wall biosynthesis